MSVIPTNQTFKDQNKNLIPATFKKAVISAVNPTAFTADVVFSENPSNVIRSVSFAAHIDVTKVIQGDKCRVDVFDENNPRDMVIAYIYGRRTS